MSLYLREAWTELFALRERLDKEAHDPETATLLERDIRTLALEMIASGHCAHWSHSGITAQRVASLALSTKDVEFKRWSS